jgi:hypothetical protein
MAALPTDSFGVEGPEVADFCRMILLEPAIRQVIGKSIENAGLTVKVDRG